MRPPIRVTSRQHPVIQRCRRAARRDEEDVVLLDGAHLLAEALNAQVPVELVITDGRFPDLVSAAEEAGAAVYAAPPAVLEAASPVRTPSGLVALARWSALPPADILEGDGVVIGLVDVQDPGNVGAAIRSADAFGAAGLLTLGHGADPAGWKALRGSMGSAFRLPVGRGAVSEVLDLARTLGRTVVVAAPAHGVPIERFDFRRPCVILFGAEGQGLPDAVVRSADTSLTVPMASGVDSLNVAATVAVVLYEARRSGGMRR